MRLWSKTDCLSRWIYRIDESEHYPMNILSTVSVTWIERRLGMWESTLPLVSFEENIVWMTVARCFACHNGSEGDNKGIEDFFLLSEFEFTVWGFSDTGFFFHSELQMAMNRWRQGRREFFAITEYAPVVGFNLQWPWLVFFFPFSLNRDYNLIPPVVNIKGCAIIESCPRT